VAPAIQDWRIDLMRSHPRLFEIISGEPERCCGYSLCGGVDLWIYGHTDESRDFTIGSTRIITNEGLRALGNQRAHVGESEFRSQLRCRDLRDASHEPGVDVRLKS
jgi:hypothetical protein